MKKILIVDVPEGCKILKVALVNEFDKIQYSECVDEFTPPSDEDIEAYALENVLDADSLEGFEDLRKWQEGAKWYRDLML